MSEKSILAENLSVLATPEGVQKYIFGTKKNGTPRAAYDVIMGIVEFADDKKKKKKKHSHKNKGKKNKKLTGFSFYVTSKKKHKKHKKHWHI